MIDLVENVCDKMNEKYKLETFTEKRETAWIYEPYKGQAIHINAATFSSPPSPWDVLLPPDVPFQDSEKVVEIPQTAIVKPCYTCFGFGKIRCIHCDGRGGVSFEVDKVLNKILS